MIRAAVRGIPTFRSQIISLLPQNTKVIDPNSSGGRVMEPKRVQFLINLEPEKRPLRGGPG